MFVNMCHLLHHQVCKWCIINMCHLPHHKVAVVYKWHHIRDYFRNRKTYKLDFQQKRRKSRKNWANSLTLFTPWGSRELQIIYLGAEPVLHNSSCGWLDCKFLLKTGIIFTGHRDRCDVNFFFCSSCRRILGWLFFNGHKTFVKFNISFFMFYF